MAENLPDEFPFSKAELQSLPTEEEALKLMSSEILLTQYCLCIREIRDGSTLPGVIEERDIYLQEILRRMKAGNNGN